MADLLPRYPVEPSAPAADPRRDIHATTPSATDLTALMEVLRDLLAPSAELLTRETFAALLDIGISTFDRLRETGAIGPQPIRLAGLKWHRGEVLAWLRHRGADGELYDATTWPTVWAAMQKKAGR